MTGPEHYREAERLLAAAREPFVVPGWSTDAQHKLAAAQVHATLALTVIQPSGYGCNRPEWIEWAAVASVETALEHHRASRVRSNPEGGAR